VDRQCDAFSLKSLQTKVLSRCIHRPVVHCSPCLTTSHIGAFSVMFCPAGIRIVVAQYYPAKDANNLIFTLDSVMLET